MSAIRRLYRGENDINFVKWWRRGLILSAVLIVISVASLFTRGLNLGIDFEGGVSWEVKAPGVSVPDARSALDGVGEGQAKIQIVGTDTLRVQGSAASDGKQDEVRQVLADLAQTDTSEVTVSTVGPSWGKEVTKSAERALAAFLAFILLYLSIRLEWKMAVGAVLAMVHDVVISVGVYSIFQLEVTPPTVIAFLTILGYSIYDTIVVFDKVKENQARPALATRVTYTELSSLSMNQVLLRSLNTSVVAILPVISMLVVGAGILGAVTLEEFAIALLVGMISGAYSSIFVAAPIVVWLKEREPRNRALTERLATGRVTGGSKVSRSEALADYNEAVADELVAESVAGDDAGSIDARSAPAATGRAAPTRKAGGSTATRPVATPSTPIPPRPRKKGKKR
jgi:preprotein translocase subunit SecF